MKFNKKLELACSVIILQGLLLMALLIDLEIQDERYLLITSIAFFMTTQLIGIRVQSYIDLHCLKSQFNFKRLFFTLLYHSDLSSNLQEDNLSNIEDLLKSILPFLKVFNFLCILILLALQLIWIKIRIEKLNYFFYFLPQISCFLILTKQLFLECIKQTIKKINKIILLLGDIIGWCVYIYGILQLGNAQIIQLCLTNFIIAFLFYKNLFMEKKMQIKSVLIYGGISIYSTQILKKINKEWNLEYKKIFLKTFQFKFFQTIIKSLFFFIYQQKIIAITLLLLAFNEPLLIKCKQIMYKYSSLEIKDLKNLKNANKDVIFQQIQIKKYSKVNIKIPYTTENQFETIISLLFSFDQSEIKDSYGNSRISLNSLMNSETLQTVTLKCLCNKNFIKYFYQKLISMQSIFVQRNNTNWMDMMKVLITQLNLNIQYQIQSVYISSLADTKSYIEHCKFFLIFPKQVQLLNLPEQIQFVHDTFVHQYQKYLPISQQDTKSQIQIQFSILFLNEKYHQLQLKSQNFIIYKIEKPFSQKL